MQPDNALVKRLVGDQIFSAKTIQVISNFEGMEYVEFSRQPMIKLRSFALALPVETGNSANGVIIGVTRAPVLFDDEFLRENSLLFRLTIKMKDHIP